MIRNKVKGAILGSAIGDALGSLVEDMDQDMVEREYGGSISGFVDFSPLSICPHLKRGQFTHKTQMLTLSLKMYAEIAGFDEVFFIEELVQWFINGRDHRYPSGAHLSAAASYMDDLDADEARVNSADVDGIAPALACGIFNFSDPDRAYEEGANIASITHSSQVLCDTAGVFAYAIAMLTGGRWQIDDNCRILGSLEKVASTSVVKEYIRVTGDIVGRGVGLRDALLSIGNGSFAPEAFAMSLFIFLEKGHSFRHCVLAAANTYGDFSGSTSGIGFISGAMSGAYLGEQAIPADLKGGLEMSDYLCRIGDRIAELV